MIRQVGLQKFKADASQERRAAWNAAVGEIERRVPGVTRNSFGRNRMPGQPWDQLWCMEFVDRASVRWFGEHPYHLQDLREGFRDILDSIDVLYYDSEAVISKGTAAKLQNPIHRVMLFSFDSGTPPSAIEDVEGKMAELPKRIPTIRNWYLARAQDLPGASGWTHVWEQEFEDEAGLGVYGKDSFHVGVVAPYFIPTSAQRIAKYAAGWHRPAVSFIA